jgi:hypothetical protein
MKAKSPFHSVKKLGEGRLSFCYLPKRSFQDDKKKDKTIPLRGMDCRGVYIFRIKLLKQLLPSLHPYHPLKGIVFIF